MEHILFFSEVNNFCQNRMMNTPNNCCLVRCPKHGLMKVKYTIIISLFGVKTSDGDVMPPKQP